jgi:hypothetical protein
MVLDKKKKIIKINPKTSDKTYSLLRIPSTIG